MRITFYFIILGILALAFGWFFFRYGRYSAFINYIEQQYGVRKAWRYIILTIIATVVIRFIMWNFEVENPWHKGPE